MDVHYARSSRQAEGLLRPATWFLAFLSASVISGWLAKIEWVTRIHPNLAVMQFNTALLFGVAAIGLLGLQRRAFLLTVAAAIPMIALGGLTGLEFIVGGNFGIDRLFLEPFLTSRDWPPGRMAPNTSAAFVVAGLGLLASPLTSLRSAGLGSAAMVIAVIAGTSWVQLALGTGTLSPLGRFGGMAVHTAAGFVVLAAAMFEFAMRDSSDSSGWPEWLSWGVLAAVLVATALLAETLLLAFPGAAPRFITGFALVIGLVLGGLSWTALTAARHARERAVAAEAASEQAKKAAAALAASETVYRSLVEQANAGIAEVGLDGRFLHVNDHFSAMVGRSRAELMALSVADVTHPSERDVDRDRLRQALAGNQPAGGWRKRYQRPDGSIVWGHVSLAVLRDVTGSTTRVVKVTQDVTDLLAAEHNLVESRRRLQSFVEHTPAAVAMFDRDLRYIAYSGRWLQDYQLGNQELLGRHHYDVFPEVRNMPEWQAVHQRCLQGAVERRDNDYFVRADGRDEWIQWEVRPWYDDRNRIGGIIMLTEVVTARRMAERALRSSEERLSLALENARHGLWDWDITNGQVLLDDGWLSIMRLGPESKPASVALWEKSIHPDDHARVSDVLSRHLESGELYDVDYRARRGDQQWIWVNTRGRVTARAEDGRPLRMIGTIHDITDRKEAEARLQETLHEREALLREVHHRVKNNLAVVASLFYLQSTYTQDPVLQSLLGDSRDRVQSMALVHEMLYRSDSLSAVDFAEYGRSLATHLLHMHSSGARVGLTAPMQSLRLSVESAIPCALILNELVTNALKHAFRGRDHGAIEIRLQPMDSGRWALSVTDDGIGFNPESSAASRSLGLRLLESLTRQLDGTLTFSRTGGGTSVVVQFQA